MQTLELIETKAYETDGVFWLVSGENLIQVDHNLFLPYTPKNEFYKYMMDRLSKSKPMNESERVSMLTKLISRIEKLK
jgi:hypothetical protein